MMGNFLIFHLYVSSSISSELEKWLCIISLFKKIAKICFRIQDTVFFFPWWISHMHLKGSVFCCCRVVCSVNVDWNNLGFPYSCWLSDHLLYYQRGMWTDPMMMNMCAFLVAFGWGCVHYRLCREAAGGRLSIPHFVEELVLSWWRSVFVTSSLSRVTSFAPKSCFEPLKIFFPDWYYPLLFCKIILAVCFL